MIISPDIIRKDLVKLLTQIDFQIKEWEQECAGRGIPAESLRDHYGNFVLTPLLVAKVQGLAALVQLNEQDKK